MTPAPFVLLAALLVGFASLAAELLWIRGLGRAVGTPYESAAAVVGLMLLGLGLGAMRGSRGASKHERPARGAAIALLVAGTWIALSPLYLDLIGPWHAALAGDAPGPLGDLLPVLLLGAPLAVPAAAALGWSFPLLVRARVMDLAHAGRTTGTLYAIDVLGALLGAGVGLALLANLGESTSLRIAGGAALLGALALLLVDRPLPHGAGPAPARAPDGIAETGRLRVPLFVSGMAALMAQMAWLRLLQPLAGAHELGAALLLAPILAAIAIGAALAGPLADRMRQPNRLLPGIFLAAGVLTLLSLTVSGGAPLHLLQSDGEGRIGSLVLVFAWTTGPASLVFGMLLPLAVRVRASWTGSTAGPAGRLYGWNALGALLGSVLAGFVLLPRLGAERTLLAAAAVTLAVAVLLRWRIHAGRRALGLVLCLVPYAVLLWPGMLERWLASGPDTAAVVAARNPTPPRLALASRDDVALYARWFAGQLAARGDDPDAEPLPVFEGRFGRITLLEEPSGIVGLRRGALRESVFAPDDPREPAATEYALGLLPALLAPEARRALVIGHGAGWTAEAVLSACDATLEVAEVDPPVLDAVRAWRGLEALPVERLQRARIVPRDGRLVLRHAARTGGDARYDLIVSQPSHPWSRASGHLFTLEAYTTARDALTDEGVMAQWLGLFDMTPALLERALASFRAAFPTCWVMRFPGEVVLLGFRGEPHVDVARWEAFFHAENRRSDAARRAGFGSPGALWKHFALDAAGLARVVPETAVPFHDDRPELELALARRRLEGAPPEPAERRLLDGFPPAMATLLPDARARERWLTQAVESWLAADAPAEAAAWTRDLRFGTSPEGVLARAEAERRGGNPRAATRTLESARTQYPQRGDVAAAWILAASDWLPAAPQAERIPVLARVEAVLRGPLGEDGRVLAAAARLQRAVGNVRRSTTLFAQAVAADDPAAPPGVRIQYARLLLTDPQAKDNEARVIELLESDPETFRDVTALDLLMRLVSTHGAYSRADELERALDTLARTEGLARLRDAGALLAARRYEDALEAARAARATWPTHTSTHEMEGLVTLCALADAEARGVTLQATVADAIESLEDAVAHSRHPEQTRARARRMLAWFGLALPETATDPTPDAE